jgi:hypothetical protein
VKRYGAISCVLFPFVSFVAVFLLLQLRGSNAILSTIRELRPEIPLSSVTNMLGYRLYDADDVYVDRMVELGRIKDKSFCRGKRLAGFAGGTWPCRSIDIYTDTNDVIVYVTWNQL